MGGICRTCEHASSKFIRNVDICLTNSPRDTSEIRNLNFASVFSVQNDDDNDDEDDDDVEIKTFLWNSGKCKGA